MRACCKKLSCCVDTRFSPLNSNTLICPTLTSGESLWQGNFPHLTHTGGRRLRRESLPKNMKNREWPPRTSPVEHRVQPFLRVHNSTDISTLLWYGLITYFSITESNCLSQSATQQAYVARHYLSSLTPIFWQKPHDHALFSICPCASKVIDALTDMITSLQQTILLSFVPMRRNHHAPVLTRVRHLVAVCRLSVLILCAFRPNMSHRRQLPFWTLLSQGC